MSPRPLIVLVAAVLLGGCGTLGYYAQAVSGHLDILQRARPIAELLDDPAVEAALRARLDEVLQMRAFASSELLLPDNDSYRRYADLERPFALWNVFAAPELSLELRRWCFLMVGCVAYRGYFARDAAQAYAAQLRAEGYDVFVGAVAAYSTLGWFHDPLLNTMVRRPAPELAGLIFHELGHQRLYVRDDSAFNESFAVAVELEGVQRWLARRGDTAGYAAYVQRRARRDELAALVLAHRARLGALYRSDMPDVDKRAGKQAVFADLRREYAALKERWGGYDGFDGWMSSDLNNARLGSIGLYHRHVAAFQRLLARAGGDLAAFYAEAERLAALPKDERTAALEALD